MKKLLFAGLVLIFSGSSLQAQYTFETKYDINCTKVKSQDRTGTCWSFSTISFLESELIRMGEGQYDLSEMYIVRNIYKDKALNYVLRQGKANFSQGSLSHDVIRAMKMHGLMPEAAYSGLLPGKQKHDHGILADSLKRELDRWVKSDSKPEEGWQESFEDILDGFLGEVPEEFGYKGRTYDAASFADALPLDPADYVSLTSFTHHPFYEKMILEIPDNYSNGSYFNVPVKEMEAAVDHALSKGMTVAWDGDVSEATFNAGEGLAVLPVDPKRTDLFSTPGPEVLVTQENRQEAFMNYTTTDDHLMHIVGSAFDQKGTKYYIIKNSWGEISPYKGYMYMSAPYFRMKTVGILLHKDAIPGAVGSKLDL
ncbi:MAG: aminopeptidase [Bacteroidetes bacterium]|nr:aminopeptidase [Bacteroidota bacterium]